LQLTSLVLFLISSFFAINTFLPTLKKYHVKLLTYATTMNEKEQHELSIATIGEFYNELISVQGVLLDLEISV